MNGELDGHAALSQFIDELKRLRGLAGSPSLRRIEDLTSGLERPLSRSTVAAKLNGESLPDWDFVISFVTACRAHADSAGVTLRASAIDLSVWDRAHLAMLHVIDEASAAASLAAFARAELSRRDSTGGRRVAAHHDGRPWAKPRQLPAATRHFVGRVNELASLDSYLSQACSAVGGFVALIDGTAGVGKPTARF